MTVCETSEDDSRNQVAAISSTNEKPISDQENTVTDVRGTWSSKAEFFLSCLGYAVGLGNVWRFPALCFKNGGGAFLIPYLLTLIFCALPAFFMEMALGQYHALGPNVLFQHMAPVFRGIGYAMIFTSFMVNIYYNMILAWTLFYVYSSFRAELPWAKCTNSWNTRECYQEVQNSVCQDQNQTLWANTCYNVSDYCNELPDMAEFNLTHCLNSTATELGKQEPVTVLLEKAVQRVSPSEDYFMNEVLNVSSGFDDFGGLQPHLVITLFLAWLIVGLCLVRGVKSSGKVVYFTALFPYVVLVALLIRGVTLEGASKGIRFYIIPKWEKLSEAGVWVDAASQIFYSLGPAFGALLTLASYNKFNNNCLRDAVIIAVCNSATSVFAGFVIFSIVGFMAHSLQVPVESVVKSGMGLAFIAYPEAVSKMPLSQFWAVCFFVMLVTLGLDSQFSMSETVITGLHDQWPKLRNHKWVVVTLTCVACFLLGLPLCARGGIYLFTLIDSYSASWSLLIICVTEFLLVGWVYGIDKFCDNVKEMIGYKPNIYWRLCWKFVSPVLVLVVLVFQFVGHSPTVFGIYVFPPWAEALGWLMGVTVVLLIPLWGIYEGYKIINAGQSLRCLFRPTKEWGPSAQHLRELAMGPMAQKKKDLNGVDNSAFSYMYP